MTTEQPIPPEVQFLYEYAGKIIADGKSMIPKWNSSARTVARSTPSLSLRRKTRMRTGGVHTAEGRGKSEH